MGTGLKVTADGLVESFLQVIFDIPRHAEIQRAAKRGAEIAFVGFQRHGHGLVVVRGQCFVLQNHPGGHRGAHHPVRERAAETSTTVRRHAFFALELKDQVV